MAEKTQKEMIAELYDVTKKLASELIEVKEIAEAALTEVDGLKGLNTSNNSKSVTEFINIQIVKDNLIGPEGFLMSGDIIQVEKQRGLAMIQCGNAKEVINGEN